MMVRLYDYDVPAADPAAGIPSLRPLLEALPEAERRGILTGLFKPERIPGTMERLTTLVEDVGVQVVVVAKFTFVAISALSQSELVAEFLALDGV